MNPAPRKVLCLDVGDARIGMAVSDGLMLMAHPIEIIERSKGQASERIAFVARQCGADLILVGLPLNMDGSAGSQARKAQSFADILQQVLPDLEIVMWDERLSTRQSINLRLASGAGRKKRTKPVDSLSAAVILQSFLDYLRQRPSSPADG